MESTAGGFLVLGALIALIGLQICHRFRERRSGGLVVAVGMVFIAYGIVFPYPKRFLDRQAAVAEAPVAVAAPEAAPPEAAPDVATRWADGFSGEYRFWAGLKTAEKFFLVFFGIFLFGCFIGWASNGSDAIGVIVGAVVGFVVGLVGVIGMLASAAVWLFS